MRLSNGTKTVDLQEEINVIMTLEELAMIYIIMGKQNAVKVEEALGYAPNIPLKTLNKVDRDIAEKLYTNSREILRKYEVAE